MGASWVSAIKRVRQGARYSRENCDCDCDCEREGLIDRQTANIYIGNITLTGTQGRTFYTILLIDLLLLLG